MRILWIDDEIEGFQSHILFLQQEGIDVIPVNRPEKGLEQLQNETFDLILLDYKMPGMDGITTLKEIRRLAPHIPVSLVTIMTDKEIIEESVASEVFDYLIKPIQPTQILALIKRLEVQEIKMKRMGKKVVETYEELHRASQDYEGWLTRGRIFSEWLLDSDGKDVSLEGELSSQDQQFARWVEREYSRLLEDDHVFSHNLLRRCIFPALEKKKVALFVLDSCRLDQSYRLLKKLPSSLVVHRSEYMAILPTATPYARNAIFAGKLPIDIERRHPGWLKDNRHERELLAEHLLEEGLQNVKANIQKINTLSDLKKATVRGLDLEVFVINFIDLLSHLKLEIDALKDLADSAAAFMRWTDFVMDEGQIPQKFADIAKQGYQIFFTTDHGWVEAKNPLIVHGGGDLSQGLRYKFGDSVRPDSRGAFLINELETVGLPRMKNASRLLLAEGYHYFVYPSDPHRYEKVYKGGIYHGGISLEEMVIPLIKLESHN
jgi:DNA-binding response OmpR family regulator